MWSPDKNMNLEILSVPIGIIIWHLDSSLVVMLILGLVLLVVATTYHNDKWLHKAVNLLEWDIKWGIHKRTQQGVFS